MSMVHGRIPCHACNYIHVHVHLDIHILWLTIKCSHWYMYFKGCICEGIHTGIWVVREACVTNTYTMTFKYRICAIYTFTCHSIKFGGFLLYEALPWYKLYCKVLDHTYGVYRVITVSHTWQQWLLLWPCQLSAPCPQIQQCLQDLEQTYVCVHVYVCIEFPVHIR